MYLLAELRRIDLVLLMLILSPALDIMALSKDYISVKDCVMKQISTVQTC